MKYSHNQTKYIGSRSG